MKAHFHVIFLLYILPCLLTAAENCDKYGVALYEAMGCKTVGKHVKDCPSEYDCENLKYYGDKCYYGDKVYGDEENITTAEPSCMKNCYCKVANFFPNTNGPASSIINCRVHGCPSYHLNPTLTEEDRNRGCYNVYEAGNCCPIGQRCPEDEIFKCIYNGVEYLEGKEIKQNETCKYCVCGEGFNGTLEEPFCKTHTCSLTWQINNQLNLQKYCAPLYLNSIEHNENGRLCCPTFSVCSDGSEKIERSKESSSAEGGGFCKFGNTTLEQGEYFKKVFNIYIYLQQTPLNIRCECKVPPLLTCVEEQ